jgi:glycosyltransferase involved in cell wall biosynthesis
MLLILSVSKFLLGYRIVTTLHNLEPHERLFERIERIGFVTILSLSDRVIVHNMFTLESAFRMYHVKPERVELIPHGNFIRAYRNDISQMDARALLGIRMDRTVFSFVGHIRSYKGLDTLSCGFQAALKENDRLHLIIAGNPADKNLSTELLSLKSANVTLIQRYLRDEEIQVVVNAADFGLLPYARNTTPGSLLLFMSFGKPVIVSDIEPVREMVKRDFAITFGSNDVGSLKEAMLFADRIRDQAQEMGRMALQEASKYDWGSIADRTRLLYNGLGIRTRRPGRSDS